MQAALGFVPITTDAWRAQVSQTAAAVNALHAARPPLPSAPKRRVGRPKRALSVNEVLAAAVAAADYGGQERTTQSVEEQSNQR